MYGSDMKQGAAVSLRDRIFVKTKVVAIHMCPSIFQESLACEAQFTFLAWQMCLLFDSIFVISEKSFSCVYLNTKVFTDQPIRLAPDEAGAGEPFGQGLAKYLLSGAPGTMLNKRVVVNVLRKGEEKSILKMN